LNNYREGNIADLRSFGVDEETLAVGSNVVNTEAVGDAMCRKKDVGNASVSLPNFSHAARA
jgi:hypothetical protein